MCRNDFRVLFLALLFVFPACAGSQAKSVLREKSTLLIIPARLRIIKLAFDMTQLRIADVVAYRGAVDSKEPVLYRWTGSEWSYVSIDDFCENRFLETPPLRVVLIGDNQILPSVLIGCVTWCTDVEILETLDIAELINSFDRWFKFRSREWKWLARRYGLTLVDTSAERRSFNPYDVKRSELPLKTKEFKLERGEPVPAVVIEEDVVEETVAKESDPAEAPQ